MIRPEGKISAATSSLLTDRTGENGVLKGWISERLPGKQGVDSAEVWILAGCARRQNLKYGVAPVRTLDCTPGPQVNGSGIQHKQDATDSLTEVCFYQVAPNKEHAKNPIQNSIILL